MKALVNTSDDREQKKNLVWVGLVVFVKVTNKLIIADSPLEDISGCRRAEGFFRYFRWF